MAAMKYPSRKTVARMSRSEVEERVERMGIVLPEISTKLPCWFEDEYSNLGFHSVKGDQVECLGEVLTRKQFEANRAPWEKAHSERQQAWLKEQEDNPEHPQAR